LEIPPSRRRPGPILQPLPPRIGGSRPSSGWRYWVWSRRADGLVAPGGRRDAGEAEVVAQRRAPVGAAEEAAALQFRDDEIDEIGKGAGEIGRQDVEPVGGALGKPFFERVGNARWRTA